jgi:hypothetical protein
MSIVFRAFEGEAGARAIELAQRADEHVVFTTQGGERHRARYYPGAHPEALRDLYELVGSRPETEVLVDDRPVPYARELWLPLVWFLIR